MDVIKILNPLTFPGWDDIVLATPGYSIFHSLAWAQVLNRSYKFEPVYLASFNARAFSALIPMMEIRTIGRHKKAVSLPFSDYTELIFENVAAADAILQQIIVFGKQQKWQTIEFRDNRGLPTGITPNSRFFTHQLDLAVGLDRLYANLSGSTRRNIKTAGQSGVEVIFHNSCEAMMSYYRLHCLTRKKHGVPPQPDYFFRNIYHHVIEQKQGWIVLAQYQKKIVAGAIFFHFGHQALYKFGASDEKYLPLRPNNLVMWEAIRHYCLNGYATLNFGRTDPDNDGLRRFKNGWGGDEKVICYYKYNLANDSFTADAAKPSGRMQRIAQWLPVQVLKPIGALLYRHMA